MARAGRPESSEEGVGEMEQKTEAISLGRIFPPIIRRYTAMPKTAGYENMIDSLM